jgi:hypothetical protein
MGGYGCLRLAEVEPDWAFEAELEREPVIASYSKGDHGRYYWNEQTPDAFAFLAAELG